MSYKHPYSLKKIIEVYGKFNYRNLSGGRIEIEQSWVRSNLTQVLIPQLTGVDTYGGKFSGRVTCHNKIVVPLTNAFQAIEDAGLKHLLLFWGGSWVPRYKGWDASQSLSSHSWGIALDLNPQWNAYNRAPAGFNERGTLRPLVAIFEAHGFAWGGWWGNALTKKGKDGMHFEAAP